MSLLVTFSPNLLVYEVYFLSIRRWEQTWHINGGPVNQLHGGGMNIMQVWQLGFTGKGVNIVNLDSGIQHTHDDLYLNYDASISMDFVDNDQ